LNASTITYLNLQVLVDGVSQTLGVVGVDGVPLNQPAAAFVEGDKDGGFAPQFRIGSDCIHTIFNYVDAFRRICDPARG
jgi:hypothetical protein